MCILLYLTLIALTPKDYMDFFRPAINQANHLKEKWNSSSQLPKVTVSESIKTYNQHSL